MYTTLGARGNLIFTFYNVSIRQDTTQAKGSGMSEVYAAVGTYTKSFYTVMNAPSFVSITAMHSEHTRLHHNVDWAHGVPVIISERHRKPLPGPVGE